MGLGKTIEMIALINHNPPPRSPPPLSSFPSSLTFLPSTLVITPPSLLGQWKSELEGKVTKRYRILIIEKSVGAIRGDPSCVLGHDVVLITYAILRALGTSSCLHR